MARKIENSDKKNNANRTIFIEKIVLSVRGVDKELEKGVKLLKNISKKQPSKRMSMKRIPGFGVRPKLEVGAMVTLKKKQIEANHFSFGIPEYIEIPGEEYDREIGIIGFGVTVIFARKGKRVARRKIKQNKLPEKQKVTPEEIIKFMKLNFKTSFK